MPQGTARKDEVHGITGSTGEAEVLLDARPASGPAGVVMRSVGWNRSVGRSIDRLRRGVADLIGGAISPIPGRLGSAMRVMYFRSRGATLCTGVRIDPLVQMDRPDLIRVGDASWLDRNAILIAGPPRPGRETRAVGDGELVEAGRIEIGRRCHIGPFTILSGIGGVRIGDDVTLSAGTKAYSLSHHYRSWAHPEDDRIVFGSMGDDERQSMLQGPVVLEANVGVGADVIILPGTTIGGRSFIRPRSVVTGRWPAGSILAGDPALREGDRFKPARVDAG